MIAAGIASRVIPRSDDIWVFGGNKGLRFADNSMYFFKYCSRTANRRVIWLTHSKEILNRVRSEGYPAYAANGLQGLWLGFRAKWHVFDVSVRDTSIYSSRGAYQLNMWHGYPIKDIRRLKPKIHPNSNGIIHRFGRWLCNLPDDKSSYYMVHQNRKYLWQITDSFDVRPENVVIANYPRNVVFEQSSDALRDVSVSAEPWIGKLQEIRKTGSPILGYFPTWRGNGTDSFLGSRNLAELQDLNSFLVEQNLMIATKWHSCVFAEYDHDGNCSEAEDLNAALHSLSNIVVLGFDQDLNSLLVYFDVLISDYSGVIVDYLLSDRPQILMPYDLKAYEDDWGFLFDYREFAPGHIVETVPELKVLLEQYVDDPDGFGRQYAEQRESLRADLFDELGGSQKIFEVMVTV